ncbi:MAG: group II intron reverse transcriptase/maturase [Steroidobacteraceae bacterium]
MDREDCLRTHSTEEGGEPQGSGERAATVPIGGKGGTAERIGPEALARDAELAMASQTLLSRLTELAQEDRRRKFSSIAHLLTPQALHEAFRRLRKDASVGVDEVTYQDYEKQASENIQRLWERLKSKQYRAQPLRRIYIPKEDGKLRAISIPSLEDKIVQKATVRLLERVFEVDFLPCSYGSRPGRNPHQALDEIDRIIFRESISYVLELDITSYFDAIVRKQLMEMIGQRISDTSILRLIGKWINIGVVDEGRVLNSETGVGQGQVISPFLANIYLHRVLDQWFEDEVKRRLRGKAFLVRYMDDAVICFQNAEDAQKVQEVLGKRFANYGLTLHPQKTQLIPFGRSAQVEAERLKTKPATFDFLGYTHVMSRSRRGKFMVKVRTMKKRLKRSLKAAVRDCKKHRHDPIGQQQVTLNAKLRGHYQYYGRASNYQSLWQFYKAVRSTWMKWLNRRTRGTTLSWETYNRLLARYPLLPPKITHAFASSRSS